MYMYDGFANMKDFRIMYLYMIRDLHWHNLYPPLESTVQTFCYYKQCAPTTRIASILTEYMVLAVIHTSDNNE